VEYFVNIRLKAFLIVTATLGELMAGFYVCASPMPPGALS